MKILTFIVPPFAGKREGMALMLRKSAPPAVSFAVTLALAAISWHALERPALSLKSRFRERDTVPLRAGTAEP